MMKSVLPRLVPQPPIGIVMGTIGLGVLTLAWADVLTHPVDRQDPQFMLLTLCLMVAVIASYHFPIHVQAGLKLYVGSVVLYLMVALLPPAFAASAIGVATVIGEQLERHRTGNPWSDTASQAGRWVIVGWIASAVAHLPAASFPFPEAPVIAAGVVLWAGDMLTGAIHYYPLARRPLHRIVAFMVRTGGAGEAAQYLAGLLGALEAVQRTWTLLLLGLPIVFIYRSLKQSMEMHDETLRILESMADTVDLRDPYTGGHSRRVAGLTSRILKEMGKHGAEVKLIVTCARVHDIGKIGLADEILRKPGKLTAEESAIMQSHPERGAELLSRYPDFVRGADIIRHHHESWDGSGYPHRLKSTEIPLGARVIAVADSYDAMTSDRPYRKGMALRQAAAILRERRGQQWDAQVVDAFLRSIASELETPIFTVLSGGARPELEEKAAVGSA